MDSIKIRDHMDRQPVLLKADMSIATAVEKLLEANKGGAPVVDAAGSLVGFCHSKTVWLPCSRAVITAI